MTLWASVSPRLRSRNPVLKVMLASYWPMLTILSSYWPGFKTCCDPVDNQLFNDLSEFPVSGGELGVCNRSNIVATQDFHKVRGVHLAVQYRYTVLCTVLNRCTELVL